VRNLTGSQPNDFTFAHEQVDGSTGLQYLRARYYDPEVGRFLNIDPFPGLTSSPATLNRYLYVSGNAVNFVDPSGMICLKLKCAKKALGDVVDTAIDVGAFSPNLPLTTVAISGAVVSVPPRCPHRVRRRSP
jgi:RHS repeat-associated protein